MVALLVVVVGVVGFGGGFLLGASGADEEPAPASPLSPSPEPTLVQPTESPSPTGGADELPDGRYFVAPVEVLDGAPRRLVFDLAYLLTGDEAIQAAIDHGAEVPPPNDTFIVNDDPRLREAPVSPAVVVRYIPIGSGSELQPGSFDPWAAAVNQELQTDYAGRDGWWWISLSGGQVVRIEQQYLP